ncbi:protein kinase [Penicillium herquei]|nr:protein kinase [Penicillium herquei]
MIMRRLTQQLKQSIFGRSPAPARKFPQTGPLLDANSKLEEETLQGYLPHHFYPVNIGDVFRSRYQVVGKLGYGGHSTVWLCRDLQQHVYATLKMYDHESSHGRREKDVYKHIGSIKSSHTGSILVRRAIDDFEISSPDNAYSYQCLVHPPLAMSLCELRHRAKGKMLPEDLLKPTLIHILLALDFLHTEAGVVHTDIQENNIMLGVEDESILVDFEEAEISNSSPRKVVDGRARFISTLGKRWEDVQPLIYRAPEVILRIPWDEKIDIWNLGTLTWDLFERGHLFYARDSSGKFSDSHHLPRMIAIMGPPPKEMLQRSGYAANFFNNDGTWKGAAEISCTSLEKLESNLEETQQRSFLCFMRKMLQWQPENRASAKELLADPWLKST